LKSHVKKLKQTNASAYPAVMISYDPDARILFLLNGKKSLKNGCNLWEKPKIQHKFEVLPVYSVQI